MENQVILTNELLEKAKILYEFVNLFMDYENTPRTYGFTDNLRMVDVHILSYIDENPGILSSQLAKDKHRSKAFISQIVCRLEYEGYIIRVPDKMDAKKKMLFVTQSGRNLCNSHNDYDAKALMKTYQYLLRDCSPEEIESFYKVMQTYNNIMNAANRKRAARKHQ
ncbi:MarR family transcriptional regulator [Lachnospiraceae bacterium 62-35]